VSCNQSRPISRPRVGQSNPRAVEISVDEAKPAGGPAEQGPGTQAGKRSPDPVPGTVGEQPVRPREPDPRSVCGSRDAGRRRHPGALPRGSRLLKETRVARDRLPGRSETRLVRPAAANRAAIDRGFRQKRDPCARCSAHSH